MANAAQQIVAVALHSLSILHHGLADQPLGYVGEECTVGSAAVGLIAGNQVTCYQAVTVKAGIGVKTGLILDHSISVDGCQVV